MSTYNSKTVAIDNLITTTWYSIRDKVADQVFQITPFYNKMAAAGKIKSKVPDGTHFEVPIRYAKQDQNINWFGRGATFGVNEKDSLTRMLYYVRNLGAGLVRFWDDEVKQKGKAKILDYVDEHVENTKKALVDELASAMLTDQSATNALAMHGLSLLISTTPTTGTVGTMDRSAHSWMANQVKSFSGLTTAANLLDEMDRMMNLCTLYLGYGGPDIILTTRAVYQDYARICRAMATIDKQAANQRADLGFGDLAFRGVEMFWDPLCPAGTMYFLNTKTLELLYDPSWWFEMTDWKPLTGNSLDRTAQVVCRCNLVCNSFQPNGVIHSITTTTT